MPLIDNLVTRYENGVTNRGVGEIFNQLPMPDPTLLHVFFDDFNNFIAAGKWVLTETGAAGATAGADGDNGIVVLTTDVLDNDNQFVQSVLENFLFATGKRAWFRARFQVSEATQSDFVIGLQVRDTSPLAVTDGVFFRCDDGDVLLDFTSFNTTNVTEAGVASMADATDIDVAFYWDGIDRIWAGINGNPVAVITPGASLPNTELTVSFGYQNGVAGAETMTVDYVYAAMER
jgi:hypothetical protein